MLTNPFEFLNRMMLTMILKLCFNITERQLYREKLGEILGEKVTLYTNIGCYVWHGFESLKVITIIIITQV